MSGLRKALIVANDQYEQEALRDLQAPAADAAALARVLGDPQIGDFDVQVMRNEPSYAIETKIEEMLSGAKPDDILLMHFSCHGLKSEAGQLYFAAANTRPNLLRSSAISADFLRQGMAGSRSRSVVLFLDCCYGGAFAQGGTARAGGDVNVLDSFREEMPGAGKGTAVITASDSMEYAFEGERLADDRRQRPSLFTSALVQGLATGDADKNEDGWVSLNELYEFVYDKVRDENPQQSPTRLFDLTGELYLTRSQRRRVQPGPLPAGLKLALANPDMYARLGAIGELRSRLVSKDLPVAAGACQALADLVQNDIQYVADVAAAALKEAALQPADAEVQFGQVEQGATPPHQTIRLLGLPIARVCTPCASDDWIRVVQVAEGLDVSVATNGAGPLSGGVNLKGVACETVVAVRVDLVAPLSPPTQAPPEAAPKIQEETPKEARAEVPRDLGKDVPKEAQQTSAPHYDTFSPPPTTRQSSPASARKSPAKPAAEPAPQASVLLDSQPIRTQLALTGLWVGLLSAGVAIAGLILNSPGSAGVATSLSLVSILVPTAVIIAALARRKYWPPLFALLQGMSWAIATWVVYDIVAIPADHIFSYTGRALGDFLISAISDVLVLLTATLIIISWNRSVDKHRAPAFRVLPVTLLCGVGLVQVDRLIVHVEAYGSSAVFYANHTQDSAAILVGLCVAWYALRIRNRTLGGAMLLGWFCIAAIYFAIDGTATSADIFTGTEGVFNILEAVFLPLMLSLIIVYMRKRPGSDPGVSPSEGDLGIQGPVQDQAAGTRP
jgi:hypothetical protein